MRAGRQRFAEGIRSRSEMADDLERQSGETVKVNSKHYSHRVLHPVL